MAEPDDSEAAPERADSGPLPASAPDKGPDASNVPRSQPANIDDLDSAKGKLDAASSNDSVAPSDAALKAMKEELHVLRDMTTKADDLRRFFGVGLVVVCFVAAMICGIWSLMTLQRIWLWMIAAPLVHTHEHLPAYLLAKGVVVASVLGACAAGIRHGTTLTKPLWWEMRRQDVSGDRVDSTEDQGGSKAQTVAMLALIAALLKKAT